MYIVTHYVDGKLTLHDSGILSAGQAVILAKKLVAEGFKQVETWKWVGEMVRRS